MLTHSLEYFESLPTILAVRKEFYKKTRNLKFVYKVIQR